MGWIAHDLNENSAAPLALFGPSAYAYPAEGTKHVIYQGNADDAPDTQIHELWWEAGSGWNPTNLSQDSGAPPASGQPSGYVYANESTQHAVYIGDSVSDETSGRLYEIWWQSGNKNTNDLTNVAGTLLANPPAGYDLGNQNVVFQGRDSHIYLIERTMQNGWTPHDLTQLKNAPLAVSPPTAFKSLDPAVIHVVYIGVDANVHHFFGLFDGWNYENVSAQSGPAPASGGDSPFGFSVDAETTLHINYRAADGNIWNLTRTVAGWQPASSLSLTLGSPLATPGAVPTGYVFPYDGTLHVNYTGLDGNIHEFWRDAVGWNWNNLTLAAFGAPPAISNPSAFVYLAENSQHVVYTADNHHLIELEWTPGLVIFEPPGGVSGELTN
jgi:hypothetical protein